MPNWNIEARGEVTEHYAVEADGLDQVLDFMRTPDNRQTLRKVERRGAVALGNAPREAGVVLESDQALTERVFADEYEAPEQVQNISVWITQRARGVYLVHGMEDRDGTEEWEATPTLAAAKRWGANYLGGARPKWTERREDGYWPSWHAEAENAR